MAPAAGLVCSNSLGHPPHDGVIAPLGMGSPVCHLITPPLKLRIEVIDVAKGPGGEEGVPQVLNLALDFAFGVSRRMHRQRAVRHKPFASRIPSTRCMGGRFA